MADTNDGVGAAFDDFWSTAFGVGANILEAKGAQYLADQNIQTQVAQQTPYTQLSRQSSNLGPNQTNAAQQANLLNTSILNTPRAVANALSQSGWLWVVLIGVVVLGFVLLRRRK